MARQRVGDDQDLQRAILDKRRSDLLFYSGHTEVQKTIA